MHNSLILKMQNFGKKNPMNLFSAILLKIVKPHFDYFGIQNTLKNGNINKLILEELIVFFYVLPTQCVGIRVVDFD